MIPAAYAVLNLDAVQHNLQMVRSYAPDAKIMAVDQGEWLWTWLAAYCRSLAKCRCLCRGAG